MSLFGSIVDKIVGYAGSMLHPAGAASPGAAAPAAATASESTPAPTPAPTPASLQTVDVGAVLAGLSEQKGGGLNYQSSILDLLKLLDLDPSLAARKQLAQELDVHAGADGSAEENIALHKAVVLKLEENGGTLPATMKG